MTDYSELVKTVNIPELVKALREAPDDWYDADLHRDAAAAIEALQAEMKRLEPKRGEWVELEDRNERKYSHICSVCHHFNIAEGEVEFYHYCPNCGAKMEVQDDS